MTTKAIQLPTAIDAGAFALPSPYSAAILLEAEIAALGEWLTAQGLELQSDTAHADEGSRDRLYWRYGYFMGLKHAQALLTRQDATLH